MLLSKLSAAPLADVRKLRNIVHWDGAAKRDYQARQREIHAPSCGAGNTHDSRLLQLYEQPVVCETWLAS